MNTRSLRSLRPVGMSALLGLALATFAAPGFALEPLASFVASAKEKNFDARESKASLEQRSVEGRAAGWKLLPTAQAQLVLTRNQYEAAVTVPGPPPRTAVITPETQRDALLSITIPIIDVGTWERMGAANRSEEAAESRQKLVERQTEQVVAQTYYQVIAAEAVLASARSTLETSEKNLAFVSTRRAAGVASELDEKRALAEVERSKQAIAEGDYQVAVARRTLETSSGMTPSQGAPPLESSLDSEPALASWLADVSGERLPEIRAARDETRALERTAKATRAGLLPSVAVTGTERFTNATGFAGRDNFFTIVATATLRFDPSLLPQSDAQHAQAVVARVREQRTRREAEDRIFDTWHRVVAQVDKARSARATFAASVLAASLAKQRYDAGTATFLDVITAERDRFSSDVARIQADADLAFARLNLRLAAGRSTDPAEARSPRSAAAGQ